MPFTGSKDADFRLVFVKKQKVATWGEGPGPDDVNQ